MELRAPRTGASAGQQFWRCTRYPTCRGRRELSAPRPPERARDARATTQAVFERRTAHARARRRWLPRRVRSAVSALRGPGDDPTTSHLKGLEARGYVLLRDRVLPGGRVRIDQLVVGPTGVFAVETRAWPGQLAVENDSLYVDGRRRDGVTDGAARGASAIQDLLVGELKPLGLQVTAVLCFPRSGAMLFSRRVGGVLVTGGRGLSRSIRDGELVLTTEEVLGLALAADEILEPASRQS